MEVINKRYDSARVFTAITIAAFAIKLPFAATRFRLFPDAISYLNIAQNISSGEGFTSSLKLNLQESSSVTHCALSDWPPLYPLFAGILLKLGLSNIALQIINALLVSLAAGFVFLIGKKLFSRRTGLIAGVFAAIAPNLFRAGISPLSDALGLVLSLTAIWVMLNTNGKWTRWVLAGALTGAACLARFPNVVLVIAGLIFLRQAKSIGFYLAGVIIISSPMFIWKWLMYGSPLYSAQLLHYAGQSFHQIAWGISAPDRLFILHNLPTVAKNIAHNTFIYAFDLLTGLRGLFFLSAGLISYFLKARKHLAGEHKLVLWIALLNLLVYALTWSIPPVKGSRFMLLSYCLLLPFCVEGLCNIYNSRKPAAAAAVTALGVFAAAAYCWGCMTAATSTKGQFTPIDQKLISRMKEMLPRNAIIASNNPWMISYTTDQPCALLPSSLNTVSLDKFMRRYRIGALVILSSRRNAVAVETIKHSGFRWVNLESAVIAIPNVSYAADYGQNAYDGTWNKMPQIVQKLPTTHSANITPRKNGSARL